MSDKVAKTHFGTIWPIHVDGFIRLLAGLRHAFDGDLDSVLILAVVGSAVLPRHKLPPDLSYDDFIHGDSRRNLATPLNTNSISQITGIPRETVRRKLTALWDSGWTIRDNDGHWAIGDAARQKLSPMTDLSLEYLTSIAEAFEKARKGHKRKPA